VRLVCRVQGMGCASWLQRAMHRTALPKRNWKPSMAGLAARWLRSIPVAPIVSGLRSNPQTGAKRLTEQIVSFYSLTTLQSPLWPRLARPTSAALGSREPRNLIGIGLQIGNSAGVAKDLRDGSRRSG
jgi:hypothetical protein